MIEDQIDELVADNAEKNLRIYALEDLLAFFRHHITNAQKQELHRYYEYIRDQHLNNFSLDEDQAEKIEAVFDALESFLQK
ncbi:hypothetical protein BV058_00917 [Haemophilus influenzae]|uniref:Uncharacterized protein n=1 Tax=Haemophilus influenzae TaxID=727 RepID=A0A2S9RRX7_HAEIF|nr:hypothetical protein A4A54_07395 [Haemophilus influenzae]PRI37853.1 hypothetical protein BVZ56_00405 [Haemophilus influenzae]PRI51915.1 hypothetical protein BVZ49_00520 [Haemophilus influenzae]PRI84661.1 hypothetical protein BV020_00141 [Haemophilus influenzae]PRI90442.1 hypothetical protein BV021_01729 [Haemophilus influenzae]